MFSVVLRSFNTSYPVTQFHVLSGVEELHHGLSMRMSNRSLTAGRDVLRSVEVDVCAGRICNKQRLMETALYETRA